MISLLNFIGVAALVALVVIYFIWKGIKRGVVIVAIIGLSLWSVRMLMPDTWNSLIESLPGLFNKFKV